METITLGQSGITITRLGFGGTPLGGHGCGPVDEAEAVQAVRKAVESGVNFFDTADCYGLGHSEELLSKTLGEERHKLVIATKFGVRYDAATDKTYKDASPRYVREALAASLERLRLETIPLYYLHWPDGVTPIQETVAELEKCRREGKIQAIGLSNVTEDDIRQALEVAPIDAVQVQYSLVDRAAAEPLFDFITENKITLVTWGSLAQGLLTGKYDATARFEKSDRRSMYGNFVGKKFSAKDGAKTEANIRRDRQNAIANCHSLVA